MRVLDTCHVGGDITLELRKHPPDSAEAGEMVRTARLFMSNMSSTGGVDVATLLADDQDPTLYQGRLDTGRQPCELYFLREATGLAPSVDFEFECEYGCHPAWRVHMIEQKEGWRVRGLSPIRSNDQTR